MPVEDYKWVEQRLDVEQRHFTLLRAPPKRIEPTLADKIHYHERYPEDAQLPQDWFEIGAEELTSGLMCTLPLYPGYKVHICHRECVDYQWNAYLRRESAIKTKIWAHPGAHDHQIVHLAEYVMSKKKAFTRKLKQERKEQELEPVDVDIEDLQKVLPPCLKPIADLRRGRFPQDAERMYLVRSMRQGGIAFETAEKLLNELQSRDSDTRDTRKRFDYVHHWKKGYKAPLCAAMCVYCPFEGAEDKRKEACHKQFQKDHPDKVQRNDAYKFRGPHSFIAWNLRKTP